MSAIIDSVGFVSGIFTIVGFFQSNFPGSAPEGAKVQIKAGLGDDDSSELGGGIQAVYGFDTGNNFIGESGSGSMDAGGITELTIDQDTPGIQADYVSISNGNDATCIAWISVTQYDGTEGGSWTGDIGANCGLSWYNGNQLAGRLDDGSEYRPKCAWIDGDHTNDITNAALKFRVRAYGEEAQDTVDNNNACESTIFATETGPINGQPAKRSPSRPTWMEDTIVMSNFTGQSAEELCTSDSSWGPDFVGTDGKFCDMSTHTLSTLCSAEDIEGCVDVNADTKTVTKRSTVARRAVNTVQKSYGKVSRWGY